MYVEAERGVVYASCRLGESRNLGYERMRRSGGREGKIRLLRYCGDVSASLKDGGWTLGN